jgi:precorrin-3B C17-methyltransferase
VVGIGPGNRLDRTRRAEQVIAPSEVVVGYVKYIESIVDLTHGKRVIASGMRHERDRCRLAIESASSGLETALISSGDAGVYGMAGLALEICGLMKMSVDIDIVPGVSAAHAAAAKLGAPLMLDAAFISLSNLLIPWETIARRIEAVAAADLVVALYNPRSPKRIRQLESAAEIFRAHRPPDTVVGIGTAVSTEDERIILSDLARFLDEDIGMHSTVIIGNRQSKKRGAWFITPRGYRL